MLSKLDKISIEKNTLPIYISTNHDVVIESFLKNKKLKDIDKDHSFLKKFKNISKKDLGILWVFFNDSTVSDDDLKLLRDKFDESLTTRTNIKEHLESFKKLYNASLKSIKDNYAIYEKINTQLNEIPLKDVPKLNITSVRKDYTFVSQKSDESLLDVFNDIKVSNIIPFVYLSFEGKKYFKIFEGAKNIPKEWTQQKAEDADDYILIKLLKTSGEGSNKISNYTDVLWNLNNIVNIDVINLYADEKVLLKNLLSQFEDIKFQILTQEENRIKGDFTLENVKGFEKHIFLDMMMNEKPFSQLLFVNDSTPKSTLQKDRQTMTVYYYPNVDKNIEKSVSTTLSAEGQNIKVHITKIKNEREAKEFIEIFYKIIKLYEKKSKSIKDIYDKLFTEESEEVVEDVKPKSKKTGTRLDNLYKFDPELFLEGYYPRDCQAIKQPTIVDKKTADKIIAEKGQDYVMEFPKDSGIYYISDQDNAFSFPGLKKNKGTDTKKKFKNEEERKEAIKLLENYQEKYPCLPCLFQLSQYDKKSSLLNKYIQTGECVKGKAPKKNATYVKQISEKALNEGEEGELTPTLKGFISYENEMSVKRRGVADSPNSFLHCVELAINSGKYLSVNDKEEYIKNVRKDLLLNHTDHISVLKQEMYAFSDRKIGEKISKTNEYFDPNSFIRLVELHYNVNIFLYVVEQKNINGEISLPYSYNNHLQKAIDVKKNTIVIVKYENLNIEWPYRCEIVKFTNDKHSSYVLKDEKLIQKYAEILYMSNTQKIIVNGVVMDLYPQKDSGILQKAQGQYIDVDGKVYGVVCDNVTIQTNPCPPLPVKQYREKVNPIEAVDEKVALQFVQKYGLKILGLTLANDLYIKSPSFIYCFINIKNIKDRSIYKQYKGMKKDIAKKSVGKSDLDILVKNRKIAHYLKEYTLWVWVNTGKVEFDLKRDHEYGIADTSNKFSDNSDFFRNGKIIITSKEIGRRLLQYIKVQKLSNAHLRENYQNKISIFNNYDYVTDFKTRPEQLIFLNSTEAQYHISKEDIDTSKISNILYPDKKYAYYFSSYKLNGGKLCIIQNVEGGLKEKALYVANEWNQHKINIGYDSPPVEGVLKGVKEFDETFVGEASGASILKYNNGSYCSLLFF